MFSIYGQADKRQDMSIIHDDHLDNEYYDQFVVNSVAKTNRRIALKISFSL